MKMMFCKTYSVLYPQCAFVYISPTVDYIIDYMIAAAVKFPLLYGVCCLFT